MLSVIWRDRVSICSITPVERCEKFCATWSRRVDIICCRRAESSENSSWIFSVLKVRLDDSRSLAEAMALVVAPLVAFDRAGHRLGMGGGWYDRSFAFRRLQPAPPWLVGAAFDEQQVDAIAAESWDVPLDAVCTPMHFHDFRDCHPSSP